MSKPLTEEMIQFVSTLFKESLVKFNNAYSFLTTCLNKPGQDHLKFDVSKITRISF